MCEKSRADLIEMPFCVTHPEPRWNNWREEWKKDPKGLFFRVDACIAYLVWKLNTVQGIKTLGRCCGHNLSCGGIVIHPSSVAWAIQTGYQISTYWMPDENFDNEFQIHCIDIGNGCPNCRGEGCGCECHNKIMAGIKAIAS